MKNILLVVPMLVLSPWLSAQQIYLRTPGTNFCGITAATNATPRITAPGRDFLEVRLRSADLDL